MILNNKDSKIPTVLRTIKLHNKDFSVFGDLLLCTRPLILLLNLLLLIPTLV